MAIFKNFPKVSTLTSNNIFDVKAANLVYKINRQSPTIEGMIDMLESGGYLVEAKRVDEWVRQQYTFPTKRRTFMEVMNWLSDGFCGIEYLGTHRIGYELSCLNAGDNYASTLIFHLHRDGTVRVGCWEDAVRQVKRGTGDGFY